MPMPAGEDVAAVLALAPPELRQCETVVAMERLIGDRDEELAFLRERCVQFEVQQGSGSGATLHSQKQYETVFVLELKSTANS